MVQCWCVFTIPVRASRRPSVCSARFSPAPRPMVWDSTFRGHSCVHSAATLPTNRSRPELASRSCWPRSRNRGRVPGRSMMSTIRLLLVDDHSLFRESLGRLLDSEPDFHMVANCAAVADALVVLADQAVDLLLLDYDLGED